MGFLRVKLLGPTRVECSESPWIRPQGAFVFLFLGIMPRPAIFATSAPA